MVTGQIQEAVGYLLAGPTHMAALCPGLTMPFNGYTHKGWGTMCGDLTILCSYTLHLCIHVHSFCVNLICAVHCYIVTLGPLACTLQHQVAIVASCMQEAVDPVRVTSNSIQAI